MKSILFIILLVCGLASASVYNRSVQTVTTTPVLALAANQNRGYLLIQNKGNTTVRLKIDSAHSGSEGINIVAGGNYEPVKPPINSIYLKSESASNEVEILEGAK